MDVKTVLRRWGRSRETIARLTADMKEIVDRLDAAADIRPQNFDGMPHGAGVGDPTAYAAFKRIDILDGCRDRMREIVDLLHDEEAFEVKTEAGFWFLSLTQENVIRRRYRENMTQEKVAEALEFSTRHVQRLERDALAILTAVYREAGIL